MDAAIWIRATPPNVGAGMVCPVAGSSRTRIALGGSVMAAGAPSLGVVSGPLGSLVNEALTMILTPPGLSSPLAPPTTRKMARPLGGGVFPSARKTAPPMSGTTQVCVMPGWMVMVPLYPPCDDQYWGVCAAVEVGSVGQSGRGAALWVGLTFAAWTGTATVNASGASAVRARTRRAARQGDVARLSPDRHRCT